MYKLSSENMWKIGLETLALELSEAQQEKLKQYVELLNRWNKTYNLTAVRDPLEMIPLHVFDSLVVADYLQGVSCLDVGSGAGLPSIPLAIIQPDREFTALDTNGKKTRFIQQAVIELGLKNVKVAHSRVEHWQSKIEPSLVQKYDAIVSRAFASINDFVSLSSMHLNKNGLLYAMKGQYPETELQALPEGFEVIKTHQLEVPMVEGQRHLLVIQAVSPPSFPLMWNTKTNKSNPAFHGGNKS